MIKKIDTAKIDTNKFAAVAFDVDGTLYPNIRFYRRLAPAALTHLPLLFAFRKAREMMHDKNKVQNQIQNNLPQGDFYEKQAFIVASILGEPVAQVRAKLDKFVYEDWQKRFINIKMYPHVRQTIENIRRAGCKTGVLSDFPVDKKLKNMGLDGIWDAALCTEEIGALKPSRLVFDKLASSLGVENERILYVGNSIRFDVAGAKNAGMKAALISGCRIFGRGALKKSGADFVFHSYRQLERFVLE
jgi:putative hydrolase of the HAD superfamily